MGVRLSWRGSPEGTPMASLQKKGNSWYCQFYWQNRRFTFAVGRVGRAPPDSGTGRRRGTVTSFGLTDADGLAGRRSVQARQETFPRPTFHASIKRQSRE